MTHNENTGSADADVMPFQYLTGVWTCLLY